MGLFNKIFNHQKESPAKFVFVLVVKSSELMFDGKKLTKGRLLEFVFFSSFYVLERFNELKPSYYYEFEKNYLLELSGFTKELGLYDYLPGGFNDFADNRLKLYSAEFKKMSEDPNFLPTKIAYNFYENPLVTNSGDNFNLQELMILKINLEELYQVLDLAVKAGISEV